MSTMLALGAAAAVILWLTCKDDQELAWLWWTRDCLHNVCQDLGLTFVIWHAVQE